MKEITVEQCDQLIKDKKFMKQAIDACKAMKPLNDFLRQAMD